jgi:hypothetical protein
MERHFFNSPADAATALGMMATYGITEIQRIGPFDILLSNGQPPSGALAGINGLDIDPDAFQVTAGFPNAADWVISQTSGASVFILVNLEHNVTKPTPRSTSCVDTGSLGSPRSVRPHRRR